jgi:hypothetical protein
LHEHVSTRRRFDKIFHFYPGLLVAFITPEKRYVNFLFGVPFKIVLMRNIIKP